MKSEVFTTRPDTLFGATYMVLAPEHPLVRQITARTSAQGRGLSKAEVGSKAISSAPNWPRTRPASSPGAFAINPVNGENIPDLDRRLRAHQLRHRRDHGRAGHDERDFEFAKKFDLPIPSKSFQAPGKSTRRQRLY